MTSPANASADVAIVVPAAGAGVRLGAGAPKALRLLAGEALLVHAIRRLAAATSTGCLVVAAPTGQESAVRRLIDDRWQVTVVAGGAERRQSVAAALAAVPPAYDIVLVHDAARALTPPSLVESVAAAVRAGHDAVIPVLPVTDTIVRVSPAGQATHLDRSTLRAVQTPQGFRRAVLRVAHDSATATATDDAGLVAQLGVPVHTVPGSAHAFKITDGDDLQYAEALLAGRAGR